MSKNYEDYTLEELEDEASFYALWDFFVPGCSNKEEMVELLTWFDEGRWTENSEE